MSDPAPTPSNEQPIARRVLPALLLALVVGASFSPALGGGFIWDDHDLVEHHRFIRSLSHIPRAFTHRYWDNGSQLEKQLANVYYRPLVTLTLIIDYQLWGENPLGYHLTNVLLHVAVTLLVYGLLLLFFRREPDAAERGLGLEARWLAAIGALIFALHPSRAEAVSWISGRTDVMMALFFVLALRQFYRALADGPTVLRVASAWLAYAGAMLCKENAVALCVVVPAADWLLLGRDRKSWLRNARWCHGPLLLLSIGFVLMRLSGGADARSTLELTASGRLNLIISSVGHYGWMFLNGYQPNPVIAAGYHPDVIDGAAFAGGIVTIVVLTALLVVGARRAPRAAWATTLLGATLAPVCNIVPLALLFLVADRFIYLPWLGVALLLLLLMQALPRRLARIVLAATLLLCATWAVTVALRSRDYKSDDRFWLAAVAVDPDNPLARRQLAGQLARRGLYARAEKHLLVALANARGVSALRSQVLFVGLRLLRIADHDRALLGKMRDFLAGLERLSRQSKPQPDVLRLELGSITLTARAGSNRALAVLRRMRGQILELYGVVQSRLGNNRQAIALLTRAVADPKAEHAVRLNLALAHARAYDLDAARRTLAAAPAKQRANNKRMTKLLTGLAAASKRLAAAEGAGFVVGKKPPDDARVLRWLAEINVILKAPARAAQLLRRAIELAPTDRQLRTMLALELAASGDLKGALATIAQARQHFGSESGLDALEQRARRVYRSWSERTSR